MALGDAGAPKIRRTTGGAAPPFPARAPPVHMGPGSGGAPTARRRRPTGDAAPPSVAAPPVPSLGMAPRDWGMRKCGGAGVHSLRSDSPTARSRRRPSGAAAPPSLRMAHGEESSREGNKSTRTNSKGSSSQNTSAGGSGGSMSLSQDDNDNGTGRESSAAVDASWEGLAGCDDEPNGSGSGGAGDINAQAGPSAPLKNLVPRGKNSVAHTPNIPPRFEGSLKTITSLIPYANKGKSYECSLSRMKSFLRWTKSEMALFFEWSDADMEMKCWMHNVDKEEHIKFTLNAAFPYKMDNINVERAAVAFSTNFHGEYWSGVKNMLLNVFDYSEEEDLKEYDYLYVFTRVGDSVFFRNFKIISIPKADDASSGLVLREINTTFCFKLAIDQGTLRCSDIPHPAKDECDTNLSLCPATFYSVSNGQTGSLLIHDSEFNGKPYSFLLENGSYISSLEKLDGFNASLAEIIMKEPVLKVKRIIGSVTKKTHCFAREKFKSIFQSLFAEFATVLESGKCISGASVIHMHNVLVRGSSVRLYGVDLTDYTDELARRSVTELVRVVRLCFLDDTIPLDLSDLLQDLENNPLVEIITAEDDCSLMKAEDRRTLLINFNSEFMTDFLAKPDDPKYIDEITFFQNCPQRNEWKEIMMDNEYMVEVCNVKNPGEENEPEDEVKDASVPQRKGEKRQMDEETASTKNEADDVDKDASVPQRKGKKRQMDEETASTKNEADDVDKDASVTQGNGKKRRMDEETAAIEKSVKKNEADDEGKDASVMKRTGKKGMDKETASTKNEADDDDDKDASVMERMKKKGRMAKRTASIQKFVKRKNRQHNEGMLQFSSKRNFHMHMPERARKDGIVPFRLGMADYILTAYFPRFLRFVQRRMRQMKAERGLLKKRKRPSYVVRR